MQTNGWEKLKLGKVASFNYGKSLTLDERSGYNYPVFGSNGEIGRHSKYIVEGPGILIGRKGSVGKVCWSDESFWAIDTVYFVETKATVEQRWFYWLLHSLNLERLDSSTGIPGLNRFDAYAIEIRRPPLIEQKAIAEILDTIDNAIHATEKLIEKLKSMKRGLLHDLLTRGLDVNGNLRDPIAHPEQFKDSELGRIPKEWEVNQLGDISLNSGDYGSGAAAAAYNPDLPRYVRITDITDEGYLDLNSKTSISFKDAKDYILQNGDLNFARSGATVGKTYLYRQEDGLVAHAGYVIKFSINQKICNPNYTFLWTQSEFYWLWINRTLRQGAQPNINAEEYRTMLLPKPKVSEQKLICERVEIFGSCITNEKNLLLKLKLQKKGLMDDLLTGRVRVKV